MHLNLGFAYSYKKQQHIYIKNKEKKIQIKYAFVLLKQIMFTIYENKTMLIMCVRIHKFLCTFKCHWWIYIFVSLYTWTHLAIYSYAKMQTIHVRILDRLK